MTFRITLLIRVSAFGIAAVTMPTHADDAVSSRHAPTIRYMPEQISAPDFKDAPTPAIPTEMRWRQEMAPGRHAPFLAQAGRLFTVGTSADYRDIEGLYAWEVATGKSAWSRPELRVVDTPWINEL